MNYNVEIDNTIIKIRYLLKRKNDIEELVYKLKDPIPNNEHVEFKRQRAYEEYKKGLKNLDNQINIENQHLVYLKNKQKIDKELDFIYKKEGTCNEQLLNIKIDENQIDEVNKHIILSDYAKVKYNIDNNYILIEDDYMMIDTFLDDYYNATTDEFNKVIGKWDWTKIKNQYKLFRIKPYNQYADILLQNNFICKYGKIWCKTKAVLILNVVNNEMFDFGYIFQDFYNKNK